MIFLILTAILSAQNPFIKIDEQRIAKKIDAFRKNYRISSISFSLFKGQNYTFHHVSGYADLTKKVKATTKHLYPLASLTKTITASIINQLILSDSIAADDKVLNYIPNFPSDVRISDLLTHQSHFRRNKDYAKLEESHFRNVVDFIPKWRTKKKFNYTNIDYSALGAIIEEVYQKNYESVVQDYFKNYVDSSYITFVNSENTDKSYPIVRNYVKKGWRRYPHKPYDIGLWQPAALAVTSSESLLAFLRYQMNQNYIDFISKNTAFVKKRWYAKKVIAEERYGYGFRIIKSDDEIKAIYHNGFMFGTLASMYYIPEYDIGFVALSNMSGYPKQSYSFSSIIRSIVRHSIRRIDLAKHISSPKQPD